LNYNVLLYIWSREAATLADRLFVHVWRESNFGEMSKLTIRALARALSALCLAFWPAPSVDADHG
jgi:hypothetical protein